MMHNVWFERAWERWNKRREKITTLLSADNRNVAAMLVAAYKADPTVVDVSIEQSVTMSNTIKLVMKLKIDKSQLTPGASVIEIDMVIKRVDEAVREHLAAGVDFVCEPVLVTP